MSFTTSATIRSLPSPQKPSPCRPRSTKWCTSACPPSLPTLQASSTTELESSPRKSLMTWWALFYEFTSSIHRHDITLTYNLSVSTDPEIISHPTQHQNVWSFHPGGDTHTFHWFYRRIAFIDKQSEVSCCIFQIARRFPGLMMKLVVKTAKDPVASFEPNSITVNATGTVTAYAIQPNGALTSLFVLNLVGYTAGMTKRRTKTSKYCFAEKNYSRLLC